ncbi:MAG: valine--tRNA ligase [Bacilli bacterium]|jgi:valyl-tRNA synthetase|nr:valine--tRNA ligase [Bacilli bacterium]
MLDTKYNHKLVEEGKYENWKNNGYFEASESAKEPFCIVIPPPNVTGKLHIGHAWDTSIQDILIRYKRMMGYDAVWIPGMDHAGIATQSKVDKKLKEELGINPRELSREEWLKHAWAWKDEYAENIHRQWAKLGLSLCYSKERFTLDEGLSKAVRKVFVDLYNKGLIYQGERIINWDPEAMTALSNEEVIYKDIPGAFYHLKYQLEDSEEYLDVATTRPETLFGDTAVAVNPDDERYNKYIGKNVILPIVNKLIPIVGDEHADMEKGTGCVKITPAHDPNDFEVGLRHNLERVVCINSNGTMNENATLYVGLDRFECREKLIKDLKEQGLLLSIENITHNAPFSERSGALIEPYLSKQWFVKMRPLADRVLSTQQDKNAKVNFVPKRFEKIMNHWMEITYDWCISRQLWWGHRIPAWYKDNEVYVGIEAPKEEGWIQDEDVLDTWFSSALWPFSTLGWPDKTSDLEKYYPNNVLVTGYDIIPFWVNRMTFQGLEFMDKRPFEYCLIHGLIRDKEGRKMSKSLGNGIDPMDMIEKYGADALRYYLTTSVSNGLDLRFDEETLKSTWNFINKLWNASRFVLMNLEGVSILDENYENLSDTDKWILTKCNKTILSVTKWMDKFELNNAGTEIYNFIYNDFCDNYIEFAKFNMESITTKKVLTKVLKSILKMLHPFMPYVTDEIYSMIPNVEENIMISKYPKYNKKEIYEDTEEKVNVIIELISMYRKTYQENHMDKSVIVRFNNNEDYELIKKILKITNITEEKLEKVEYNIKNKRFDLTIYYEKELTEEDKILKEKEIESLKASIAKRKGLLSNDNFVSKAPINLVEEEKVKLQEEEEKLKNLEN